MNQLKYGLFVILLFIVNACSNAHNFNTYITHYNDNKENFSSIKNYLKEAHKELMMSPCAIDKNYLQISYRGLMRGCFSQQQDTLEEIFSLDLFDTVLLTHEKNSFEFYLDFIPSKHPLLDEINIYLVYEETILLT